MILLLVATAISAALWLYERDSALPYEAIAISGVVLLNAVMGYVQASRAESAVAALRQMSAARARVVRDGEPRAVPAADLVPGDIILVEEGDTIPADARVIQSTALQTAEAALTGESLPVAKDDRADWRRGQSGRPHEHALQRDIGDLRSRTRGGRRHGDADRDGTDRRHAGTRSERDHAASEGARSRRQDARIGGRDHCGCDDRDDRRRGARARVVSVSGRAHSRRCARCRSGTGGPAGDCHRRPLYRRTAHGAPERHRPSPQCRRNAWLGLGDRVGQDRNPDEERDDRARGRHGKRSRDARRDRVRTDWRRAAGGRGPGHRRPSNGIAARAHGRRSGQQRRAAAARRALDDPGRSD